MMTKVMKVWHSWFPRNKETEESQTATAPDATERKPPSAIAIRTAMRQKQKLAKASS